MENDNHHLAIAQSIVRTAERENRGLTENERRRAEKALERVREIRDNEAFTNRIERFNAELNHGGSSSGGFGAAVFNAGFVAKSNPSVTIPLLDALQKAPTLPAVADWNRAKPVLVPMGMDQRFLNSALVQESVDQESSIQDFRQTGRVLTGSVSRALDATSDKASLDSTITLVNEALQQMAVIIPDLPNGVLESVPRLTDFLNQEGQFQISKALDAHAMSQIIAAAPPFGTSGSDIVAKIRNGISSMRAEGANPNVVVLNPTDAASLDLFADAGGLKFPLRDTGSASPLFGLQVVERAGAAGTEPIYLLDTSMLGRYYLGGLRFDADPYSGFAKNLTTLRLEMKALFHVRNAKGARRVAAT